MDRASIDFFTAPPEATTRIGIGGNRMNVIHGTKTLLSGMSSACLLLSLFGMALSPAAAQTVVAKPPVKTPSSGGNSFDSPGDVKYESSRDVEDRRIDMFIGDWRDAMPRHAYGSLVLRDILTRGDNYAPPQPGALLQAANYLAYGRLQPGNSTVPTRLEHEQNVFYIVGGTGEITTAGKTAALRKDVAIFMPAGLEFAMKNTGDEDLTM